MKDTISLFVMEESPSVLSIGRRCADSGYGFVWMPGEEAVMFDYRKSVIRLRVKGHIPHLVTKDETEHGPLGKLTESAIGVLDYPEDRAVDMSGGLTSSSDETPIAAPAEEPGKVEEDDADERDKGGGGVEAGRGVKRKKGPLKHEADTLQHMVSHGFANPYCDACVRAKIRKLGTETDTNVFVARDVYSGVRMAYPTSDGSADEVVRCLKDFMGRRKIRVAYGDHAPHSQVRVCSWGGRLITHCPAGPCTMP